MKLYHLPNSKAIDGFYVSSVIVCANNMDEAKGKIIDAVSRWLLYDEDAMFRGIQVYWSSGDKEDERDAKEKYGEIMQTLSGELNNIVECEFLVLESS